MINLAGHEARWLAASAELARAGLAPERLDAVAGVGLPADARTGLYDPARNAREYHKPLCAGEIGCYASHLEAWRRLVDSGRAAAAVFEDDIEADGDLPAVLEAIERIDVPWDMVKLVGRRRELVRGRASLVAGRDLVGYRRVPSLTAAYVVTRRGAEKLLARRQPFGRPIDVDLRHWWECDLRVLGIDPYPVRLASASCRSTILHREARGGAAERWRKLAWQLRYSWRNRLATQAQPRLVRAFVESAAGGAAEWRGRPRPADAFGHGS